MLNNNNIDLFEELKKGYSQMSDLNLELARESADADNEALLAYEDFLDKDL